MRMHSGHQVHLLRQTVGAAAGADEPPLLRQIGEHAPQRAAVIAGHVELFLDVLDVPGAFGMLLEEFEEGIWI